MCTFGSLRVSPATLHDTVAVVRLLVLLSDLTRLSTLTQGSLQHLDTHTGNNPYVMDRTPTENTVLMAHAKYVATTRPASLVRAPGAPPLTHLVQLLQPPGQFLRHVVQLLLGLLGLVRAPGARLDRKSVV